EIEVRHLTRHQRGVGQAGELVFGGMPGDGQRRRHRFPNGLVTTAGGAGRALALADVQGDAEALVTVEFDGFHFALAHRGGQALLHGYRNLTGARALPARLVDDALDLFAQRRQRLRANSLYFTHNHSPTLSHRPGDAPLELRRVAAVIMATISLDRSHV